MFICEENFICESRELGWAKDKICLMKEAISTRCCPRYILPLIGIESQSKAKQSKEGGSLLRDWADEDLSTFTTEHKIALFSFPQKWSEKGKLLNKMSMTRLLINERGKYWYHICIHPFYQVD